MFKKGSILHGTKAFSLFLRMALCYFEVENAVARPQKQQLKIILQNGACSRLQVTTIDTFSVFFVCISVPGEHQNNLI